MKAYDITFKLFENQTVVLIKFSDIRDFIWYFTEESWKLYTNHVFDHFKVTLLDKQGHFWKAQIKTNRLIKNHCKIMKLRPLLLRRSLYLDPEKNTKFFFSHFSIWGREPQSKARYLVKYHNLEPKQQFKTIKLSPANSFINIHSDAGLNR